MLSPVAVDPVRANSTDQDEDISLRELLLDLWRSKLLIVCTVLVFTVGGLVTGLLIEKQYEATVVLSPAQSEAGGSLGGLGALASQYSGLASLVGISMSGGTQKSESVAVLQSELLTTSYIRDNNLLPVLYADLWDAEAKKWLVENPAQTPTLWKANRYFKKIRRVTDDKKSGLVMLSIRWKDPELAARWANDLVRRTNDYLREKAIRESTRNVTYLKAEAAKTNVVEARRAIFSLLEDEVNKEMMARGRDEYALKVIDPASVPERPSTPGAVFMAAIGFAIGGFIAVVIVLGRRILLA